VTACALLVSETRDHGSKFTSFDDAIRLLVENNVLVFAAAFSPYLSKQLDTTRATNQDEWRLNRKIGEYLDATRQAMRKNTSQACAVMTGGEYKLFTANGGFETDLTMFSNHLHSRYDLSFVPNDPHRGLHQIGVNLRNPQKDGSVLFRSSYWIQTTRP
jgi:hypothetical protein